MVSNKLTLENLSASETKKLLLEWAVCVLRGGGVLVIDSILGGRGLKPSYPLPSPLHHSLYVGDLTNKVSSLSGWEIKGGKPVKTC